MRSRSSPTRSSSSRSSPRRSRSTCASTRPPSSASRRVASARSSAPASRVARRDSSPARPSSLESDEPAAHGLSHRTGRLAAPRRSASARGSGERSSRRRRQRPTRDARARGPAGHRFADASAQLGALATRDQLTNLPDHRAFHEQLRSEARRAERHERALSLVLINIDDFKQINAEHGRLAGDRALAEVGRRLAATVRNGELVSRLVRRPLRLDPPGDRGSERLDRRRARPPRARRRPDRRDRHRHRLGRRLRLRGRRRRRRAARARRDRSRPRQELRRRRHLPVQRRARRRRRGARASRTIAASAGCARSRASSTPRIPAPKATPSASRGCREKLALSCGWNADLAIRLAQAALAARRRQARHRRGRPPQARPALEAELEQIRNHPDTGAEIAVKALDEEQLSWIRHHHERWDGAGYPSGVAGEAIPAGARLLALAEAWDAMTSSRVYGEALEHGRCARRVQARARARSSRPRPSTRSTGSGRSARSTTADVRADGCRLKPADARKRCERGLGDAAGELVRRAGVCHVITVATKRRRRTRRCRCRAARRSASPPCASRSAPAEEAVELAAVGDLGEQPEQVARLRAADAEGQQRPLACRGEIDGPGEAGQIPGRRVLAEPERRLALDPDRDRRAPRGARGVS